MKKLIRNRLFSRCPVKHGKERKAISYQKKMEAYKRRDAAMTDVMLTMYARNLNR